MDRPRHLLHGSPMSRRGLENRVMPRFARRLVVRFAQEQQAARTSYTTNVGPHGIFIASRTSMDKGVPLTIDLTLPNDQVVTLRGKVAWNKRVPGHLAGAGVLSGFGVQVTEAPEGWYQYLATLG